LSNPDASGWQRTSPFAAVFYLGKIYEAIAKNAVQSLAPLAAFLVAFKGDPTMKIVVGVGAFILGTIALAFLRYWFFRYCISDNSLLIRAGVFKKTQLDIKFERIQAVNTQQNVVFRMLGLLTVSFDTAGSSGQEGYLPAIEAEHARDLRDRIRRVPRVVTDEQTAAEHAERPASSARPLLQLTSGDMVRIGLSSNRVFLLLIVIGPLNEFLEQFSGEIIEEGAVIEFLTNGEATLTSGITFGLLLTLGILVVLFLVSIAGAFLRFHRYELVADDDVLRSTGGLLTRHEHSVNRTKVQSLHASQHVVLRLFRRFRLRAKQASASRIGRRSDFLVPICAGDEMAALSREFFPQEFSGLTLDPRAGSFERISRQYLRSRIGIAGVLPALLSFPVLWSTVGPAAFVLLLWIPACAFLVWQKYRRYGVMRGRDGLAFRSGLIGYRVVAWLHRKVQRISITQSPLQRRKQLATLRIFLAAGSAIKIPYVDYAKATALRDYILYRVESSRQAWH